eukprot:GHRR01008466.1.p1 GENE.GHRR01008466.1~~GHRR01008466.1.p1  ORF type:complete len:379 (+),score=139.74 GHRR01008466.1:274-1410(+)
MHHPALKPSGRVHEDSITILGWTASSRKAPIIGSDLLDQYCEQLGGVLTLPEILFGNSTLQLRHNDTGLVIEFNAFDALKRWRADNLPPLKVHVAQQWQAARLHEIRKQQAVVLEYDWTYTTSYTGSTRWSSQPAAPVQQQQQQQLPVPDQPTSMQQPTATSAVAAIQQAQQQQEQPEQRQQFSLGDGATAPEAREGAAVHSTAYKAPSTQQQHAAAYSGPDGVQVRSSDSSSDQLPQWQPSSNQIDRGMLMSKDEPILFYAEVPLYESELDDNGVSQLTVKVRVMPRCWLVLLRFFLRVDGCLVRLREVRHFCRLDAPSCIIRETKHCEGTVQELATAGAPTPTTAFEDAEAAAGAFAAITPQCLKKFELHELQIGQ